MRLLLRNPLALLVQLPIPPPGPQPIEGNVPLAAAYLKLFAQRRGLEGWQIEILPARLCNRLGDRALAAAILDRQPAAGRVHLLPLEHPADDLDRPAVEGPGTARPEIRILLGGPEITADNRWVLEQPAIDLAVIGEGEQTFVELLSALRRRPFDRRASPGCGTAAAVCRRRARRSPIST